MNSNFIIYIKFYTYYLFVTIIPYIFLLTALRISTIAQVSCWQ